MLVSFSAGTVTSSPGYDRIRALPSFLHLEAPIKSGDSIERTVDLFTNVGSALLMNQDPEALARDVQAIRDMEADFSMFELEEHATRLKRPRASSELRDAPTPRVRAFSEHRPELADFSESRTRAHSEHRPDLAEFPEDRADEQLRAVVVVDPYSTGACVALECFQRGFKVISMWSLAATEEVRDPSHQPQSCRELVYHAQLSEEKTMEETSEAVRQACGELELAAVIVGGESGVPLADALSEHLGVRTNGTQIPQRRDKKIQQELVKAAGLRSVRQAGGTRLEDVEEFLRTEQMPVVVKPVESAGSDGVKLCHSEEEAREHFEVLMGAQQKVGSQGAAVLCQEFLRGQEYVVDHVSMDGVHKTVMIWVYNKRAVNGAAFVYHGMLPVPSDSPEAQVLIPYVRGVLDALQIRNGPTHGEVMMTPDGPCLVEMNCRAHGGDGAWMPLAQALTGGYSQVDAAADSFLDAQKFDELPDRPPSPFLAAGQEVMLVSFAEGKVTSCPGYERIKALDSFVYLESAIDAGCRIDYTTDLFTNVGSAILMHTDEAQLRSDIEAIRKMEKDCALFGLEEHPENLCRPRARSEHVTTMSGIWR